MGQVIDIAAWLASVHREVRSDTTPRRVILKRRYETDLEDLWAAVTSPERVARWFGTIAGEPTVGQTIVVTALGGELSWTSEILQCEAPHRFVMTWRFNAEHEGHNDLGDEVELRLVPEGDGTLLELEHRSPEPRPWEAGVGLGWEGALFSLEALLKGVDASALFISGEIWPHLQAPWVALAPPTA